jgi:hypothetical protein
MKHHWALPVVVAPPLVVTRFTAFPAGTGIGVDAQRMVGDIAASISILAEQKRHLIEHLEVTIQAHGQRLDTGTAQKGAAQSSANLSNQACYDIESDLRQLRKWQRTLSLQLAARYKVHIAKSSTGNRTRCQSRCELYPTISRMPRAFYIAPVQTY